MLATASRSGAPPRTRAQSEGRSVRRGHPPSAAARFIGRRTHVRKASADRLAVRGDGAFRGGDDSIGADGREQRKSLGRTSALGGRDGRERSGIDRLGEQRGRCATASSALPALGRTSDDRVLVVAARAWVRCRRQCTPFARSASARSPRRRGCSAPPARRASSRGCVPSAGGRHPPPRVRT